MEHNRPVIIYEGADKVVEVRLDTDQDTVWLTQRQLGELFGTTPENVLMHLEDIFKDMDSFEPSTSKDFLSVQIEGRRKVRRNLRHYNLDATISVGYRVNSRRSGANDVLFQI